MSHFGSKTDTQSSFDRVWGRVFTSLALMALSACASGQRPMKQLETAEFMVGGNLNLPGATALEMSGWVRFSPWTYIDLTVGGLVGGLSENGFVGGGLVEGRGHVPITPSTRLVLTMTGELLRQRFTERDNNRVSRNFDTSHRIGGATSIAFDDDAGTIYFGPKLVFHSYLKDRTEDAIVVADHFYTRTTKGILILGGHAGAETEVSGLVVGCAIESGLGRTPGRPGLQALSIGASLYVGY